uniref:Uncharacterized protein n=1 Tax=Avena sativa TaxID=4498 RepID=A0ACD5VV48_AVESA
MASHELPPSSPTRTKNKSYLPPPPTTICALSEDLLREIFLRLPSLPSLVRAALACGAFLNAVRSSSTFRRRFRSLHSPPLLGIFLDIYGNATPGFSPLHRRSDLDLAAAVRGADFFLTRLPDDDEDAVPNWAIEDCRHGCVLLPHPLRLSRRVGCVCCCLLIRHEEVADLPMVRRRQELASRWCTGRRSFRVGETKDGELCLVCVGVFNLHVWVRRADRSGGMAWMMDKTFLLKTIAEASEGSLAEHGAFKVVAVVDGYLYLSTFHELHPASPCLFLSFCVETSELSTLCPTLLHPNVPYPYIMAWPPSLVRSKLGEPSA